MYKTPMFWVILLMCIALAFVSPAYVMVGTLVTMCVLTYINKDNDWYEALSMLDVALALVVAVEAVI